MALTQQKIDTLKASLPSEIDDLKLQIKAFNDQLDDIQDKKNKAVLKLKEKTDRIDLIAKLEQE